MSVRTCQLCGKALGRFAVGSGGDFCSREHRNQYRLRLGMDRLLEASKVANLMRRRENMKLLTAGKLATDYNVAPRCYPHAQRANGPAMVNALPPRPIALHKTRVSHHSGNFLPQLPQPASMQFAPRPSETRGQICDTRKTPCLQSRSYHFPVRLPQTQVALVRYHVFETAAHRRECSLLRHPLLRVHVSDEAIRSQPSTVAGADSVRKPQRARKIANTVNRGKALRVSGGVGFRVLAPGMHAVEFKAPQLALPARGRPHVMVWAVLPEAAGFRFAGVPLPVPDPSFPAPVTWSDGVQFRWPGTIGSDERTPCAMDAATRSCATNWNPSEPSPPHINLSFNGVGLTRPTAPDAFSRLAAPCEMQAQQRLTLVSFEPQDSTFEYTPMDIHSELVSGPALVSTPLQAPAAPLEDRFDAGLRNWTGGTSDWKLDAAGVRTGSLALYAPSLEMCDYVLEFLARIDHRSVTWVFRATDTNDYYAAKLAVAPDGGYQFSRWAVIGGAAEPAVTSPVGAGTPVPAGKSAITIRTQVVSGKFSVSLEGHPVDTWTDDRLPVGGIGFIGAPDDRARLYWVKISPAAHSKEHWKQ